MANAPYIALADDDLDDQEMLAQRILKNHPDIPFKFFQDGQEITSYLQNCPTSDLPTLLILDYKMPILTGADVLKIIQKDNRYDTIRKIVWSTSSNNHYASECRQYGAEKYFTKPNSIRELDDILTQLSDVLRSMQTPDRRS
jgi:CheY-like chemotaxis protein